MSQNSRHSVVNNSTAKYSYAFSKEPRFRAQKSGPQPDYYELPSGRSRRATSLGYGKKEDISKANPGPGPGHYQLPPIRARAGRSFGLDREAVKSGAMLTPGVGPGPAAYLVGEGKAYKHIHIHMHGRLRDTSLSEAKLLPGPGQYSPARMQAGSVCIGKARRRDLAARKDVPGPGLYNLPDSIASEKQL
jgi:hypothetical protein